MVKSTSSVQNDLDPNAPPFIPAWSISALSAECASLNKLDSCMNDAGSTSSDSVSEQETGKSQEPTPVVSHVSTDGETDSQHTLFALALSAARPIADLKTVRYPEGIVGPRGSVNNNATPGKFVYDRDFLLQFMLVCQGQPVVLAPLEAFFAPPQTFFTPPDTFFTASGAINHYQHLGDSIEHEIGPLLAALSLASIDTISSQIVGHVNKAEQEKNGERLNHVARLIYAEAIGPATTTHRDAEVYARLCRHVMERMSPNIRCHALKDAEGTPISGAGWFHRRLLACCRKDFEWIWPSKSAQAVLSTSLTATHDRGRALVIFVAALFKEQLVTERVLHKYATALVERSGHVPQDMRAESLCDLLSTAGHLLERSSESCSLMDVCFKHLKALSGSSSLSSQVRSRVQEIIALRESNWNADKQKIAREAEAHVGHEESGRDNGRDGLPQSGFHSVQSRFALGYAGSSVAKRYHASLVARPSMRLSSTVEAETMPLQRRSQDAVPFVETAPRPLSKRLRLLPRTVPLSNNADQPHLGQPSQSSPLSKKFGSAVVVAQGQPLVRLQDAAPQSANGGERPGSTIASV